MTRVIQEGTTNFTVDSALLRELGERLVGKPHIALAELVKNSYDADAHHVDILFEGDYIEIVDNGHGMSQKDFENFWMRVGSPHKQAQRFSEFLQRSLTGSKGVGRLAVQFLARKIDIKTCRRGTSQELHAEIDWDTAVRAGDLTKASATWKLLQPAATRFARGARSGTSIRLTRLRKQTWSDDDFKGLGEEIWWLQPPFVDPYGNDSEDFAVELTTPYSDVLKTFEIQMRAFMSLWHAKLDGCLVRRDDGSADAEITMQFSDEERFSYSHRIEHCLIDRLKFELRTYYLTGRQRYGIKVGDARQYFEDHGGVYVYDSGFRLPYYGGKEHDWLGLEFAHAHRLSRSRLLPEKLQVAQGLTYLPTNSRILGAVQIDTAQERSLAQPLNTEEIRGENKSELKTIPEPSEQISDPAQPEIDYLEIQVTRDRLVDNRAYEQLRDIVRAAIDFYAVTESRRAFSEKQKLLPTETPTRKLRKIEEVLEHFRAEIPVPVFMQLSEGIAEAANASESEAEVRASQIALLAPLATAGMAALAYEHEVTKQLALLVGLADRLDRLAIQESPDATEEVTEIRSGLRDWISRARQTRRLFTHLLDEENRERDVRLRALPLLRDIAEQSTPLLRGSELLIEGVDQEFRLPVGTFAEWSALFQNVFVNASNAMLDATRRSIRVWCQISGSRREIRVEDTGVGIDLGEADHLFEPFARNLQISPERRELGLGGSGLGLTIVRMIAENRGCQVDFTEPIPGFSTAFRIYWKEI